MNILTPLTKLNNTVTEFAKKAVQGNVFIRNRKLPAATLIKTILNMQGNSLNKELYEAFNYQSRMTASAFVTARKKLSEDIFEDIFTAYNKTATTHKKLNGYRVFAIDGTDFHTPYSKDSEFVMPITKEGVKPYCLAHGNIMMDLMNQTYEDCIIEPSRYQDERAAAIKMLERANHNHKSLVIMDRGYTGYNVMEHLNRVPNMKYVIRSKTGYGAMKCILELPDKECDKEVELTITTRKKLANRNPDWYWLRAEPKRHNKETRSDSVHYQSWDFEETVTMKFRLCKFKINDEKSGKEVWEVLITNLDSIEFPLSKMKALYHMRWDIETSFRALKYDLGGVQFHSKKDVFIRQEIFAHLTMFNVVSRNRMEVEITKENTKHDYAIDFKMATVITRDYYKKCDFSEIIFEEMKHYLVPIRKERQFKRNLASKSVIYFTYRVAAQGIVIL